MNFLELVKQRHSVRSYEPRAIEKEKLDYVMECVRMAPSAVNFQPWKFAVVTDEPRLSQLKKAYPREWISNVPCLIVACVIMRNHGIASRTGKTMPTLTWPLLWSTFAWPPQSRDWAPAGYAILTYLFVGKCFSCPSI